MWNITGGSIPGSDHTMPGKPSWKNNQDAYFIFSDEVVTIGIVADGCGSSLHSEVGSQLGVRIFGELLRSTSRRAIVQKKETIDSWQKMTMQLLGQLSVVASQMGESFSNIVGEHFLFSLVGFIILPKNTYIFHCGDGVYAVDNRVSKLGPFKGNAPPYLSYSLLGDVRTELAVTTLPTDSLSIIAVGTDGVEYIQDFENKLHLWGTTDVVFSNPDVLRRKLAMLNLEKIQEGLLVAGPLKDDTTLVIARKTSC